MTYIILPLKLIHVWFAIQGCTKGQKSGGAGSNAARRHYLAAPSDLPKSWGRSGPPGLPLGACLLYVL